MITVVAILVLTSTAAYEMAMNYKVRAVHGSYERYAASTQVVFAAAAGCVSSFALGFLLSLGEVRIIGIMFSASGFIWVYRLKDALDDDNWFNNQRERLGNSIRRFGERLASGSSSLKTA